MGLSEDPSLLFCFPLNLGRAGRRQDLDVVDGKDTRFAAQLASPPMLVDRV